MDIVIQVQILDKTLHINPIILLPAMGRLSSLSSVWQLVKEKRLNSNLLNCLKMTLHCILLMQGYIYIYIYIYIYSECQWVCIWPTPLVQAGCDNFKQSKAWRETQTASSRIWTRVTSSISYNDNLYTKYITMNYLEANIYLWVCLCIRR